MATEKDNVNAGLILTIVIAGAIIVGAIVMVVTAYTRAQVREQTLAVEGTANLEAVRRYRATEHEDMHAPAEWWDEEAKVTKIPTTHAEVLVVRDIAADPYAATRGAAPPPPVEEGAGGAGGASGEAPAGDVPPPTGEPTGAGAESPPKAPAVGTEEH